MSNDALLCAAICEHVLLQLCANMRGHVLIWVSICHRAVHCSACYYVCCLLLLCEDVLISVAMYDHVLLLAYI